MNPKLKKFLHNFFKIFIIFLIGFAFLNLVLFLCIYLNHKSKLKKEAVYLNAPGEIVNVDGHAMHVLEAGEEDAETTLVFLHSGGVVDDSIALQPLFKLLQEKYRCVYVDRSGVGFSAESGASRDIDTILEDTRKALELSENKGPYVVVATGTAGIEACHWANKYPEEVEAIIGITMKYPEEFKETTTDDYCGFFDYLTVPFCKIGGMRLIGSLKVIDDYGIYNEGQVATRNALIMKGGYTQDMYNEDYATVDNAMLVADEGWPVDTPCYLIYSNPVMEPFVNDDETTRKQYQEAKEEDEKEGIEYDYVSAYNQYVRDYFEGYELVEIDEISGPARIYTYAPDKLAQKIETYLDKEN